MRHQGIGCAVIAFALLVGWPAAAAAQDAKAAEIIAATRKAIGDKKLEALKTLTVEAGVQRNLGNLAVQSDVEVLLEMPDKFTRTDTSSGGGMINLPPMRTGFSGDRAILPPNARMMPGGGMVFSMTVGGASHGPEGEKPTPEQVEQMNKATLRNQRGEISKLMLGWFGMTHPSLPAQYTYAGEAESPDGKAHVIDVKDDDGFAARLFIDQNSKLPLMVTYMGRQRQVVGGPSIRTSGEKPPQQLSEEEVKKLREQQGKAVQDLKSLAVQPQPMIEYTLFFDDWREVDGIHFPHLIRRASKGTTEEEWTIKKVKVNPKIDAKKFTIETP